jgi:xylulokinase
MILDNNTGKWSDRLLEIAGIDKNKLATSVMTGTVIGTFLPEIAILLGMSPQTKIVAGGHDQLCNTLGGGAQSDGTFVNCSGTVECIGTMLADHLSVESLIENQLLDI